MKLPYLASALLLHALAAPFALAQTSIPNPARGNVSTVNINLTVNQTIGGWKINSTKKAADALKLISYPNTIQYDAVYFNSTAPNALLNPYGWTDTTTNNYVEKVTDKPETANTPRVVTAEGSNIISKTRYTNATLLAEVLAAEGITDVRGYRIVAVRFDTLTDGEDVYTNTALNYMTLVKRGLYFFAEKGANDPSPIYLGAEDNVYNYQQIIDFSSFETAEAGKYKDVFTGGPNGFIYSLASDAYSGLSLAEFAIYRRPTTSTNYYELRAGGVFNWKETYDAKADRKTYNRGAINGTGLTGPATLFSASGEAQSANSAIVTGSVTLPAASFQGDLNKYLLKIPPLATN